MRLLNISTFELEEYNGDSTLPPHAVLSHRWYRAEEEVSFIDFHSPNHASHKKGFAKLQGLIEIARARGLGFVWCDTCCINKASTTELSTALNSMFRWYRDATHCIAFLEDVVDGGKRFEESVWFRRGWTLQELIAPREITFYGSGWKRLGTKEDFLDLLSSATRIPRSVLSNATDFRQCSVAQRMSWAADRETGEMEDRAYSLMGLFDISLEMIYGEGEGAFIRLQERIIAKSADQSIFTWSLGVHSHPKGYSGLLALSPSSFAGCSDVVTTKESTPFSASNIGLSIQLSTLPYCMDTYYAFLDCTERGMADKVYAILVARLPTADQYARVVGQAAVSVFLEDSTVLHVRIPPKKRQIWVRQFPAEVPLDRAYGLWVRTLEPPHYENSTVQILSRRTTAINNRIMLDPRMSGTAGIVSMAPTDGYKPGWSQIRWIQAGFDDDFHPVIMLTNDQAYGHWVKQQAFDMSMSKSTESSAHQRVFAEVWAREKSWETHQRIPSRVYGWPGGYYILKFAKAEGGTRDIEALNLRVSVKLLPDCSPDREPIQRTSNGSTRSIWTLDLITLPGRAPERDRHGKQCSALTMAAMGFFIAFTGGGCVLRAGLQQFRATSTSGHTPASIPPWQNSQ